MYQEQDQRIIHDIFLRHAKPIKYGETESHIASESVEQIQKCALNLARGWFHTTGKSRSLFIYCSNYTRTRETADELYKAFEQLISQGILRETQLAPVQEREALRTGYPLTQLRKRGVERGKLLSTWLSTRPDQLERWGIRTPMQMAAQLLDYIAGISRAQYWPDGLLEIDRIHVTHETSFAALLGLERSRLYDPQVGFMEPLTLSQYSNLTVLGFRDEVF